MNQRTNLLAFALLALITFFSCSKAEDADNVIKDPEGLVVELTWSNDAANPTTGTDLELYIRQNFNTLLQSNNFSSFEKITITPGILNDGTYNLDVFVDNIDRVTNYSLKFTGKSTAKEYVQNFGPINANDNNTTLKPLSLTISGNQYSVQ